MKLRALCLLALLAACDDKPAGGSTTSAPVASAAPTAASAAPTATASASAEPAEAVHIHLDSVKTISGKNDFAARAFELSMPQLRTTCVQPALKVTPTFEGTLKMTLAIDANGKITKATPSVVTGKIPDDVQTCFARFFEEKTQLPAHTATVEGTILLGPHVAEK
jgi:hypothetical protein